MSSLVLLLLAGLAFLHSSVALRSFDKRIGDLENVKPVADSGYTVPLQAGKNSLPSPASGKVLKALTIARGVLTYDCPESNPGELPIFVSQNTDLYDVAPLIPFFSSEDLLHELVPLFASYDYSQVKNSSLICIGYIYTSYGDVTVDLGSLGNFVVHVDAVIPAPINDEFNGKWAHSTTSDNAWEVYRVETAGGAVPASCSGQNTTLNISYGAEYWFYHS